jgi:hypothetical protein
MIRSGPITRPAREFVTREKNPWLEVSVKWSDMFALKSQLLADNWDAPPVALAPSGLSVWSAEAEAEHRNRALALDIELAERFAVEG